MTLAELVYVVAGILLPAYYLPQMLKCAVDETRLAAYSMSKAASQLALRMAMLPFVFGFDNLTMTCVVALDFAGRASEFAIAVWSLSRQGVPPREILTRCLPFGPLRDVQGELREPQAADRSGPLGEPSGSLHGERPDEHGASAGSEGQRAEPPSQDGLRDDPGSPWLRGRAG